MADAAARASVRAALRVSSTRKFDIVRETSDLSSHRVYWQITPIARYLRRAPARLTREFTRMRGSYGATERRLRRNAAALGALKHGGRACALPDVPPSYLDFDKMTTDYYR